MMYDDACAFYTADTLGIIVNMLTDKGVERYPKFTELMMRKQEPEMTAEQVKAHLLKRLST